MTHNRTPPAGSPHSPGPTDDERPAPEPPQHRSWAEELVQAILPDAADHDRRRRNRKVFWSLFGALTFALASVSSSFAWQWVTAEANARHEKRVKDKIDRADPAFTPAVRRDTSDPIPVFIFNRKLSPGDEKTLTELDTATYWKTEEFGALLKKYGGHRLSYPSIKADGYSTTWIVDLVSDRAASLVVNGMRLKGLQCEPATAETLVVLHPEGGGEYASMFFDLTEDPDVPLISGSKEKHYGEPYFDYKKFDLGNGATSAGLRIEVTPGFQDCRWKAFEVTYVDSKGTHRQDITNKGKPFVARGAPKYLSQVFGGVAVPPYIENCATQSPQGLYGWCRRMVRSDM